ncbi:MAG: sugar phosphate nucleotidyltransferase, partial [bacterium]
MDVGQMVAFHRERGADATVAALPVPVERGREFGIIAASSDGRITAFVEKPAAAVPLPDDPTRTLASLGNYLFTTDVLVDALVEDARRSTDHDFGRTILPELVWRARVYAYNFRSNTIPGMHPYEEQGYWRDVGTLEAYWEAHMDLLGRSPRLDLSNPHWPVHTAPYLGPSARILEGSVEDSLVGEGCHIDGATVRRSVLGRGVRVLRGAVVEESVVMDHTVVGTGAHLRRVIADRFNDIPAGAVLGRDDGGLTVLPRGRTRARA